MSVNVIHSPQVVDFCKSPVAFVVSGTETAQPNYKLAVVVVVYQNGGWVELPMRLLDVDKDGAAVVSVGRNVRDMFDQMDLPGYNQSVISRCQHSIKEYYIKVSEYYGEVPELHGWTESSHCFMLKGKLPFWQFPGHNFWGDLKARKGFLTNIGKRVKTWYDAQQYLYWGNYFDTAVSVKLKVKAYFSGGDVVEQDLLSFANIQPKEIVLIPTGAAQLDLNSIAGNGSIYRYDLTLVKTTLPTEDQATLQFRIIPKPLYSYEFLFMNDFGVFESLLCTGQKKRKLKTAGESYRKELPYDYKATDSEHESVIYESRNNFQISTGLKPDYEAIHLEGMLTNNVLFSMEYGRFIRCELDRGSFAITDDKNDNHPIKFKYKYAFER
ncbi:hypothetical protein DF185_19970 [Marinifilum breve]|uniref:Uncharacterized protein n=1 Tax=Marinifilum breve TaxID=2184082 RepID=A0A2V4A6A0_9BACT|nr:hypothetical protein [Marinifilum breve]PXX96920.1 hypothetical protein DF185_19970 [Marinifilum breve]